MREFRGPSDIFSYRNVGGILYTGLLSPRVIFAFLHLQIVSPNLEFAQT